MAANVTKPTDVPVPEFLAGVAPAQRRADAVALDALFRRASGFDPVMWGPTIIGYGRYTYLYESGRTGTICATGFSPRKAEQVLYILPEWQDYGALLAGLGKYRASKACLYVRRLPDIDMAVLEDLIRRGLSDLHARWPVMA